MHSLAIFNVTTLRMEKPPYRNQKIEKVFHFDLKGLRRVADDIKNLQACMARLMFALDESDHPESDQPPNIDDFLQIVNLPLPDKLVPLPPDTPPIA